MTWLASITGHPQACLIDALRLKDALRAWIRSTNCSQQRITIIPAHSCIMILATFPSCHRTIVVGSNPSWSGPARIHRPGSWRLSRQVGSAVGWEADLLNLNLNLSQADVQVLGSADAVQRPLMAVSERSGSWVSSTIPRPIEQSHTDNGVLNFP